jgi:hypothetical protein
MVQGKGNEGKVSGREVEESSKHSRLEETKRRKRKLKQ